MRSRSITQPLVPLALTAALAGGCVPTLPLTTPTKPLAMAKGAKPKPAASVAPPVDSLPTGNGGGLISDNGGGLISNNAGNLVGTVQVPSHLISDNGGGLISDNGGGYRVLALPAQRPLAGATVRVLDAAGQPVLDAAGKPLTATTDAQGKYALQVPEPARHLVVSITLPAGKGTVSAIALKESRGTQPVDADLVSTLTTGYVMSQYVRGQADPGAALAKLPADVEAETRSKAADAYRKSQLGALSALAESDVVDTVEKLKAADSGFAAQMEKVRRLLVAAGQSDLGAGRLGTEVSLGGIRNLAIAPDGTLYLNCPNTHRIWRLAADGRLYTAAGNGTPSSDNPDGKPGPEAGLKSPLGVSLDAQARPLILDGRKQVFRLETDGRLKSVVSNLRATPRLVVGAPDGRLHGISVEGTDAEYWTAMPGEAAEVRHVFTSADLAALKAITTYGLDAKGRLCFSAGDKAAYRFDPQSPGLQPVAAASAAEVVRASFDAQGNLFVLDQAADGRRVRVFDAEDAATVHLDKGSGLLVMGTAVARGTGGAVYFDAWGLVRRLQDRALTTVAGTSAASATSLDDLVLSNPAGVAFTPAGELLVADSSLGSKVWKVKADRSVVLLAGGGSGNRSQDEGDPKTLNLGFISRVRTDAAGNVYFFESTMTEQTIRQVSPAGAMRTRLRSSGQEELRDFAVAPDGTLYLSFSKVDDAKVVLPEKTIRRLKPDETTPTLLFTENLPHSPQWSTFPALWAGPDGALYLCMTQDDKGRLKRWTEAEGLKVLKEDPIFKVVWGTDCTTLARDAQGRFYVAQLNDNRIVRYDPTLDTVTAIAGAGAARFNGEGVDASIVKPRFPAFNAAGDLYFADSGHQQVKVIPAADLP